MSSVCLVWLNIIQIIQRGVRRCLSGAAERALLGIGLVVPMAQTLGEMFPWYSCPNYGMVLQLWWQGGASPQKSVAMPNFHLTLVVRETKPSCNLGASQICLSRLPEARSPRQARWNLHLQMEGAWKWRSNREWPPVPDLPVLLSHWCCQGHQLWPRGTFAGLSEERPESRWDTGARRECLLVPKSTVVHWGLPYRQFAQVPALFTEIKQMLLLRVKADLRALLRRQNHHSLISCLFPSFSAFCMQIITLFTSHKGHSIHPSGWWKGASSCLYADLVRRWLQGKESFVIKTYSFLLNRLFLCLVFLLVYRKE